MMKKLALGFGANGAALYLAKIYVPGLHLPADWGGFLSVVAILTLINFFIRPLVKLTLWPFVLITFGLGLIVVNALMLYLLDFLLPTVTISGLTALALTTLVVSVVNWVVPFLIK